MVKNSNIDLEQENYWVESQVSPKASSPQSNAQTKMKVIDRK